MYLHHEFDLIISDWSPFWPQSRLLLCVKTEENTLMKEALGRMKNTKEKNMCWQDGRLFDDKEDWVVDSCTKCTCQVLQNQMERWTSLLFTDINYPDACLIFIDGRSPRLFVTKLHALQWPVPSRRLLTASAAPCVCVSTMNLWFDNAHSKFKTHTVVCMHAILNEWSNRQ